MDNTSRRWPVDTLSFLTYGTGRLRMATSMRMLGIEMAKRNFWLSTLHDALMLLSQNPRVGMHCNRVRKNYVSSQSIRAGCLDPKAVPHAV